MAHSPLAYDRGTRFTNYSSIHSADAFVGDYQVMYTPGTSPPQPARSTRKSTRFSRPSQSGKNPTVSQSYILPSNIPHTSQVVPDTPGLLPNVKVRSTMPADEKQIVASLRTLQGELSDAMKTIKSLTEERDDAMYQLRVLKATSRKTSTPKKQRQSTQFDEELFDLSQMEMEAAARRSPIRPSSAKKVSIARGHESPTPPSQHARNLSHMAEAINKAAPGRQAETRYKKPAMEDQDQSVVEDATGVSNTSRRRRHHHQLDENMTSAYILPDITVAQPAAQRNKLSKEAQRVVHSQDPQHIRSCDVCRRLLAPKPGKAPISKDYTAQITQLINDTHLDDPTIRPKISPAQALANVRQQLHDQYERAKQKFGEAWEQYDAVEAPLMSKKHEKVGRDLVFWQEKMEEYRVLLDNVRDVEEGMIEVGE